VLRRITPRHDMKTPRLDISLRQRMYHGQTLDRISESSASSYPPESGRSRCLFRFSRRDRMMR